MSQSAQTYDLPSPSFKFKYQDAGTHPISGQKLYSGSMIVEMPDGTVSTYRAGQHNSREKLKNDFNRMMAGVNASLRGQVQTVDQNYGTQSVDVSPSALPLASETLMSGGALSAPETFIVRDKSTGINQVVDQQGIRQGDPFYGSVNRNDPNYDVMLDAIIDPDTGIPTYDVQYVTSQPVNQSQSTTQPITQPMDQVSDTNLLLASLYPGGETVPDYQGTPISEGIASINPQQYAYTYVPR